MRAAYIEGGFVHTEYDVGEIIEDEGALFTPFRMVENYWAQSQGAVQNDEVARRVGFQGGVVRGVVHIAQMPRVLLAGFGQEWFERGGVASMFIKPTMHGDHVRIGLQEPELGGANERVQIWVERESDGLHLVNGTAEIGDPAGGSLTGQMILNTSGADQVRILADHRIGQTTDEVAVRLDSAEIAKEPSGPIAPEAWFRTASPWGGPIANPANVPTAAGRSSGMLNLNREGVVGMLGAQEVKHVAGPVFLDHDYVSVSELVAVGSSKRSEYAWYEARLLETDGTLVAKTTTQMRFLKKSSPLWADEFPEEDEGGE
jgi:acyl dehydratase